MKKSPWNFALVQSVCMDDKVISVHRDKPSAEKAMRKLGGEPDSLFTKGMRVCDISPTGPWELITIFNKRAVRPRNNGA